MAAVELATGYISMTVETAGVTRQISKAFEGGNVVATKAGQAMGDAMAKSFDRAKPDVSTLEKDFERSQQKLVAAQEKSGQKMEAAMRKVEIAQAKVNETTDKYGPKSSQALTAADRLATAQQRLEAETMAAESALGKLESELKDTEKALSDARSATDEAGDSAEGAASKYASGWKGIAQRIGSELTGGVREASEQAADAASEGGTKAGGFWSRAMETAVGVGIFKVGSTIVSKVGGFLGSAFQGGFSRLTAIDDARAKLTGLGNDAASVETIMDNALQSVTGTAYGLDDAATVAAGAVAAGIKPGQELEGMLSSVANAAAASGSTLDEMGAIFNKVATTDMAQMDVLNQVSDRGIPIIATLADQLGVSAGEVRKLASDGKIGFEEFQTAMTEASGTVAEEMGGTFTGSVSLVRASLSRMGANLWSGIFEKLAPALQGITGWFKELEPVAATIGEKIGDFVTRVADGVMGLWDLLVNGDFTSTFREAFGVEEDHPFVGFLVTARETAIGLADYFTGTVVPAFKDFGDWVVRNKDWLMGLVIALGTGLVMFKGYLIVQKAATFLKTYATMAELAKRKQDLLNTAMFKNPLGLVLAAVIGLAAGLTWFFTQTETGRKLWSGFVGFLGDTWEWFYNDIVQPVIGWIVEKWQMLVTALSDFWESHGKPIFEAIGNVFSWLWESIVQPYIGLVIGYYQTLWNAIKWAWEYIGAPVFETIGALFRWLWENVVRPTVDWISDKWNFLMVAMQVAWQNYLKPAIDAISSAFSWVWNNVLSPVFTWIGDKWQLMIDLMVWLWHTKLQPAIQNLQERFEIMKQKLTKAWGVIKDVIKTQYERWIKPIIDRFKDAVGELPKKFEGAKDGIERVWEKIKGIVKAPVKFAVETVINKGLIGAFNGVRNFLGLDPIPDVALPKGFATGGWTGPGSKYTPAGIVHADEYVIRKESQNQISRVAPGFLDALNRFGARALGYARGGLVHPTGGRGRFTSGFGASRGRWPHAGVDYAVPVGTPIVAAMPGVVQKAGWNAITGRTGIGAFLQHDGGRNTYYGHLSKLLVGIGDIVKAGQRIGLSGNTGRSTGPHLHFETWTGGKPVNPSPYLGGAELPEGEGGGFFNPIGALLDAGGKIKGWLDEKFPVGGAVVEMAAGMGMKVFDSLKDWATDKLAAVGDWISDTWSATTEAITTTAAKTQVRAAAIPYGWATGNQWASLNELIRRESNWNVLAANPNSSARGLFQKMTSIHGDIEGTATGQARWGLDYIKKRYGSPQAAINYHDRHGHYYTGGLVRDRGGVVPPGSSVINNWTRDPEWMYTDKQQDTVSKALDVVKSGKGYEMHVHLHGTGATVGDAVRKMQFEQRKMERV